MAKTLFTTKSGKFDITQYSAGKDKGLRIQLTDMTYEEDYHSEGHVRDISSKDAVELGEALIKWGKENEPQNPNQR